MLQQTRVAAVVPYYERFLRLFPDVESLARAPEEQLLAAWSGLGYYSRARNLQRAARTIVEQGGFPEDYDGWRRLPGVGDYTAAAVASIVFNRPHAVADGNVLRVLARLENDHGDLREARVRKRLSALAQELLDPRRPGEHNQAMMELGAVVCLPRKPRCGACPVAALCAAHKAGTQEALPVRSPGRTPQRIESTLLVIERGPEILLRARPEHEGRLAGFWELPEAADLPEARLDGACGEFRHAITHHRYRVRVVRAQLRQEPPDGLRWVPRSRLGDLPLTTMTKKALALVETPPQHARRGCVEE